MGTIKEIRFLCKKLSKVFHQKTFTLRKNNILKVYCRALKHLSHFKICCNRLRSVFLAIFAIASQLANGNETNR